MRADCLSWESAEMELGKLQREFEKKQAQAEQMAEDDEGMCPHCGEVALDEKEELCPECLASKAESRRE